MAKKSKVAEFWDENQSVVIGVGTIAGVSFVGYKVFQSLGIFKDAEDKAKEKQDKLTLENYEKELREIFVLTKSEAEWLQIADAIHESLNSSAISDNKASAERLLKLPENALDLHMLIVQYGKRQHYIFGIPDGEKMSLPQHMANGELSKGAIERINENYRDKGISLQF